jgi:hypothetical protein
VNSAIKQSQAEIKQLLTTTGPYSSTFQARTIGPESEECPSLPDIGPASRRLRDTYSAQNTITPPPASSFEMKNLIFKNLILKVQHHPRRTCEGLCLCSCHSKHSYRTSPLLRNIIGELFIRYSGLPKFISACDVLSCARSSTFMACVTYRFPAWWVRQCLLLAIIRTSTLSGTLISIKQPRLFESAKYVFSRALTGDISSLARWYDEGWATPMDVCPNTGMNIIRVGKPNTSCP